jgi:hypothetical protein
MIENTQFDPTKYLTKLGSADYLEVKWRLVWLRAENPDADINTELIEHQPGEMAVFKATISLGDAGSATGYGSESKMDFRDYLEKAETKAIGRALGALGFGTQFTLDFDYGTNPDKPVVDSPVTRPGTTAPRIPYNPTVPETRPQTFVNDGNPPTNRAAASVEIGNRPAPQPGNLATERQLKFLEAIAKEAGLSEDELAADIVKRYGVTADQLTRRDASAYIEGLQNRKAVAQN